MVGVGVLSNIPEAEFIADDGAASLAAEKVYVAARDETHDGGLSFRSCADFFNASLEVRNVGLGFGFLPENLRKVHVIVRKALEGAFRAVERHVDDGSNFGKLVVLLLEAPGNEDDIGFSGHEALKVDFLQGADVSYLRRLFEVLRQIGKRGRLRERHDAVLGKPPVVERVENGVVGDGDALRGLGNRHLDGLVLAVEGIHFNGFGAEGG